MPIPSSAPSKSAILQFSTAGDAYEYPIWVDRIRWTLTTAATTTWALAITQCTAVYPNSESTYAWPVIGSSTQSVFLEAVAPVVEFPINALLYGVSVPTLGGGLVQVIKGHAPHDMAETFES
ncbi:MAG: hypothetical protein WC455_13660 [Dehalococcoidia bacterium]|jgi:hypothetical protein